VLRSDQLNTHGNVFVSRAEVHALAGDTAAARFDLLAALDSYRRKGNRVWARHTEQRLADLSQR
jgi:hypothetical protein